MTNIKTSCFCAFAAKNLLFLALCFFSSCNMFYVAMRNVPVFFSSPAKVKNKIKNPVHQDVRLSALWIGHSTVLLQMDDKVIITDPFLSETIGELARRVVEPGIDPKDIPHCDVILISHSHFDHLSFSSLEMLAEKSPDASIVFPEDVENHLPDFPFEFVKMKNDNGYRARFIGDVKTVKGIKITSVFAQHWGGRYGLDGFVWGDNGFTGFILEYNDLTVYFAGDTGYDSAAFRKIGGKFKINLALIPIGPCAGCTQPGTRNHVFPLDAIQIFRDINAEYMLPVHYGTLQFAQADPMDPAMVLTEFLAADSLSDKVNILKIGEQKIYLYK